MPEKEQGTEWKGITQWREWQRKDKDGTAAAHKVFFRWVKQKGREAILKQNAQEVEKRGKKKYGKG